MIEISLNDFLDNQNTQTAIPENATEPLKNKEELSLNEFLNVTGKDYIPYEDRKFNNKSIQDYWKRVYEDTPSPDDLMLSSEQIINDTDKGTPIDYLNYLGERIQIGWDGSTQGLVRNFIQGKELPLAYDQLVASDKDWLGGFVQQVATLVGDTP